MEGRDVQVGSVVAFSWKKIVIRRILATVPLVGRVVRLVSHSADVGVVKYKVYTYKLPRRNTPVKANFCPFRVCSFQTYGNGMIRMRTSVNMFGGDT